MRITFVKVRVDGGTTTCVSVGSYDAPTAPVEGQYVTLASGGLGMVHYVVKSVRLTVDADHGELAGVDAVVEECDFTAWLPGGSDE